MEQELTGIRYQSKVYPTVQTIMHRVNEETLMMEHLKQNPRKATGVDGVTKSRIRQERGRKHSRPCTKDEEIQL